jgi:hypothetical protein
MSWVISDCGGHISARVYILFGELSYWAVGTGRIMVGNGRAVRTAELDSKAGGKGRIGLCFGRCGAIAGYSTSKRN